ncbi:hypothetical protein PTT_15826 [Pyrenophora teres f. teres 0-1]|uniref:Uncharacterized protein n=1 Tax=Pyrenophora teres f. teres (strain 0-1) TaxID=861557 RepID=E3S115_PYRTT|nr:hypothetical protein PTT_15826 [Pyrenophora teres f. teres 0-1]
MLLLAPVSSALQASNGLLRRLWHAHVSWTPRKVRQRVYDGCQALARSDCDLRVALFEVRNDLRRWYSGGTWLADDNVKFG